MSLVENREAEVKPRAPQDKMLSRMCEQGFWFCVSCNSITVRTTEKTDALICRRCSRYMKWNPPIF